MSAINKIIHNWTFHPNGGHYTKEILDGDLIKNAEAEFDAKESVIRAAKEIIYDWDERTPHVGFISPINIRKLRQALKALEKKNLI